MRTKVALFLIVVMLCTVMLPFQGFALENTGLEQAIQIAKTKFTIPAEFSQFNYNVNTQGESIIWQLTWSGKDQSKGMINVSVNDKGTILSYENYKNDDYSQRKFPKISKEQAKAFSEDFVKKLNPDALLHSKLRVDNYNSSLSDPFYYFTYVRNENGIPFNNNYIRTGVSRQTGEVQSYNYNWTDGLTFPKPDNVIPLEQAQTAYKDKLGLKLVYNYSYNDEKLKTFAVYQAKYNSNYFIDAFTGDKVELNSGYYGGMESKSMDMAMNVTSGRGEAPALTPEEQNAVEDASKLITRQDAEKIARGIEVLKLTEEYKVMDANLYRDWMSKNDFAWNLYFIKELKDKSDESRSINVRIDAKTGEVKDFSNYSPYNEKDPAKFDEKASKEAVEKFLEKFSPVKFTQTEYDDSNIISRPVPLSTEQPTQYYFTYTRKVNGIQFPGNSIQVIFNAVTGEIISYNMTWFDVEFPPVDKVVSLDSVYKKLFSDIGLELQYKIKYSNDFGKTAYDVKMAYENADVKSEVKLVYSVNPDKPLTFDANTGGIIGYDGKPYKENKPVSYTDITGHYAAQQISILAEYGVSLEGPEFKPNESITQKDFMVFLSKTLSYYYSPLTSVSTDEEIGQLYSFLISQGIIKESEKAPTSIVTKEDGVKFILRALKYDKVADIKGIFNCTFKDVDKINPDLIGYVAIAQGLKIVNGYDGYFNPKAELTRAQVAIIIYNYLQI